MDEVTLENYKSTDIKELTLNPRFGALTFDNSANKLEKIKNWFSELEDLDYSDKLPENITNGINAHILQLIEKLNWLRNFDITDSPNAKQEHDDFETQVDSFFDAIFNSYVVNYLNFLRQDVALRSKDKKTLQKEQKELAKLRKESELLVKELTAEKRRIQGAKKKIESAHGEKAAVSLGKHFEIQAIENIVDAHKWLQWRNKFFVVLLIIICLNVLGYFILFFGHIINSSIIPPKELFTIEYGLAKLALLSILSYGVAFTSRNFSINSNLGVLNKHRKNVAETLNDILKTNPEKEDRSKVVENATDSMFKHLPIGYVPKSESRDDGPIASIINNFIKPNTN